MVLLIWLLQTSIRLYSRSRKLKPRRSSPLRRTLKFNRQEEHILKFLSKELAAPSAVDGMRGIIQRKLRKQIIDDKIKEYAKEFVICHECGRPDTKVGELENQKIVKCEACGAWWPMRRIK